MKTPKSVIVFDGEDERHINLEFFFQDELIENLKKEDVVELLTNSMIYENIVKNPDDNFKDPEMVSHFKTIHDKVYFDKLERGISILEGMLRDMVGDHNGNRAIEIIKSNVKG